MKVGDIVKPLLQTNTTYGITNKRNNFIGIVVEMSFDSECNEEFIIITDYERKINRYEVLKKLFYVDKGDKYICNEEVKSIYTKHLKAIQNGMDSR